jgi:Golgi phosphoprotein 3 GPP34
MELILAEQLLLLFLDDEKGSDRATWGGDPGLAGAILLDLTAAGALTESEGDLVAAGGPPAHPLLADAHAAIAGSEKRRDAKGWVGRLPNEQLTRLAHRIPGRSLKSPSHSGERSDRTWQTPSVSP